MQRTTLFKEKLKTVIKEALLEIYPEKEEYFTDFGINIEYPDVKFGDYASPVAMQAAKIIKKPPMESGSQLKNILQSNDLFAEVKLVKPGFLNFYMSASALETVVKNIEQDKNYGRSGLYAGQKILLEFVSANPTGPLHIGHGRWAVIGDVLANILNFSGAAVEREFYINDTGEQIKKLHQTVTAIRDNRPVPEDGYHGKCMQVFRHNRSDPVTYFLNEHKKTLTDINTFFDRFFPESELHQNREIEKIFTLLQSKNVLYEKDKALWFKATAYGDEKDRVLRKADGSYSYFGVDIAYHMHKLSRQYDKLINVLGADHHGYLKRIKGAVSFLSENKVHLDIVLGQLVNLYRGGTPVKMSKRSGDIITLKEVAKEIGVDALRYFLTMRSASTAFDFDLELAKQQNADNPVYYIQYSHARLSSLKSKARAENISAVPAADFNYSTIAAAATDRIAVHLLRFPDEIAEIASSYEIHHLNNYLYELAALFHRFYNKTRVINPQDPALSAQLLYFCAAVQRVLARGLKLLGIGAPAKM